MVVPSAWATRLDFDAPDPQFKWPMIQEPAVYFPQLTTEALRVPGQPVQPVAVYPGDLNARPVLSEISFGLGDVRGIEIVTNLVQVDLDPDPLRVASLSRQHPCATSQTRGADIESHTEQAELRELIITTPACS